jgi:hypothetical protein
MVSTSSRRCSVLSTSLSGTAATIVRVEPVTWVATTR